MSTWLGGGILLCSVRVAPLLYDLYTSNSQPAGSNVRAWNTSSSRYSPSGRGRSSASLRNPAPLAVRPLHPCSGVRRHAAHPALARHRRVKGCDFDRYASAPASLRPSLHIHVQSFGRSDESLYLVGKTSDLTLPDSVRCHILVASTS